MTAPYRVYEQIAEEIIGEDLEPVAPERVDLPPLRTFNAFATFRDPHVARRVVVDLERAGVDGSEVSALALAPADEAQPGRWSTLDSTAHEDVEIVSEVGGDVAKGAGIGAVAGGLAGAGVAVAIPGVASGAAILAVAAGGAVAGTGVGAFAGAVSTTPASPGWEQSLIDLRVGAVVVGVHTDDHEVFDRAIATLGDAAPGSLRKIDPDGAPL